MVAPRAVAFLLASLSLAVCAASAGAGTTPVPVPTGLHGFLLRADEPPATSFPRTPAFAWNPVTGAASYEFQLSTSSAFRENGIVWQCPNSKGCTPDSPIAAPPLSLPWITGSPHALYARVRSVMPNGSRSDWSASFGFDVVPAAPPTPQASAPGVLRWTTVPGADGYQVWLVDAKKQVAVYTNVLDERDYYTFHSSSTWTGSVRWRVRAFRSVWNSDERVSGVPVSQYGPWSPIYKSTNPAVTTGQIQLGSTISDVITNGKSSDPAHRLMPAFTWNGNQTLDGSPAELFRVYVFTDKECLNPVFVGSVVGGPSYAPRPYGGLVLPLNTLDISKARSTFLPDLGSARGTYGDALTYDGQDLKVTENQAAATPTTTVPLVVGGGQSPAFLQLAAGADLGAPVSLWDTDWPHGGYYWTVVPVQASTGSDGMTLASGAPAQSTTVLVSGNATFAAGDQVQVGAGGSTEILAVKSVAGSAVTFQTGTLIPHSAGDPIVRLGGNVVYQDMELPQDVCAAGRVGRFGIDSEPSLTSGDDAFASGLSPTGRLTSAVATDSFYRGPVVSWTPALGAGAYQVQWSKTATPFVPVAEPKSGAAGVLTGSTSYVLPSSLTPGTWYYRVRGLNWTLPTGAQGMGWSDPTKIVVSSATFKVVPTAAKTTKSTKPKKR